MTLNEFNTLPDAQVRGELLRCCGSRRWALEMSAHRPYTNFNELIDAAEKFWTSLSPNDRREAFSHHPRIGDIKSLRKKFAGTAQWAKGEQAGVDDASERTLKALAEGNRLYEAKFGYIFIVCATGKTAEEMLGMLNARLNNIPTQEITVAAGEQSKITVIRLTKLLEQ